MDRPTRLHDLPTPALLVDAARLEQNLQEMAALCRGRGVRLRPHAKTHKSATLARRQLALGAAGLCTAKVGEAAALMQAPGGGIDDVVVAFPLRPDKAADLLALAERTGARVATVADSPEAVRALANVWRGARELLRVYVKVDVGFGRVGVAWSDEDAVARVVSAIGDAPGLWPGGLLTHAGHAYAAAGPEEVAAIGRAEGERMVALAAALRARGLPVPEVSVGSTPTARHAVQVQGVTELRPGVYVFNDMNQVRLGVVPLERCALTVLTEVVARPGPDRAVCDAGAKTFSSDKGAHGAGAGDHGLVLEAPARLVRLSEEHGWLAVETGARLRPGERIRVVPAHCCATVNLADHLWLVDGERVVDRWPVEARGCVR